MDDRKLRKEKERLLKAEKFKNKTATFNINKKTEKPKSIATNDDVITTIPGEKKDTERELPKSYNPTYTEEGWFAWWQKQGYFKPEYNEKRSDEKFSMVIPPPNVTGVLHIGHALTVSIEDCLVRYQRMMGKQTLWIPGTDHAGIATQSVVEKRIMQKDGLTRHDLGRDKFVSEVWKWKEEKGDRIMTQLSQLGSSCDFSRMKFTMDEGMYEAVTESFVRLYEDGSVYRARRLVNWSCALKSAISDIEVEKRELTTRTPLRVPGYERAVEFGVMVHFSYLVQGSDSGEKLTVATTRIETMLADTAVAVHPEDERYKHLVGQFVVHPFIEGRKIPIVADTMVEKEFGTGAVKITPAHDHNDYAVGKRHNLEFVNLLSDDGLVLDGFGEFSGMKRFDCRREITKKLKEIGLFEKDEAHSMVVPICSRSKDIIEPLIKNQWYLRCGEMAAAASEVVRSGDLQLLPQDAHEATWARWLDNCHDWCISRQLWWGHRIPMWRVQLADGTFAGTDDEDSWVVGRNAAEALTNAAAQYGSDRGVSVEQDSDVLDTWFSSQLFPFATMGWPHKTADLDKFFPTNVLETGHDILFFWVARMVMIGLKLTGKLPFSKVFLHAMVRDAQGRKMSKSLGNVLDPYDVISGIELADLQRSIASGNLDPRELERAKACQAKDFPNGIPQCGTDALRFALISYSAQIRDINLDVQRVFGYRTFCNKLWQAHKFCSMFGLSRDTKPDLAGVRDRMAPADRWMLSRLAATVRDVNVAMQTYNFSGAASHIHRFWIYEFCDVYIEYSKALRNNVDRAAVALQVMLRCLDVGLRLLHPLMPFITEELHQRLPRQWSEESICVCPWPLDSEMADDIADEALDKQMEMAMDITRRVRSARKDRGFKDKDVKKVWMEEKNTDFSGVGLLEDIVLPLSNCTRSSVGDSDRSEVIVETGDIRIGLVAEGVAIDIREHFHIRSTPEAIETATASLGSVLERGTVSEREALQTRQWCSWLSGQKVGGKAAVKATLGSLERRLTAVTFLADTRRPWVADHWLMEYLHQMGVVEQQMARYTGLSRWFQTVTNYA